MECGDEQGCCQPAGLPRRQFLKLAGVTTIGLFTPGWAFAGPFQVSEFQFAVPVDKKLRPEWVRSLSVRGKPTVYKGKQLDKIGMPIGGLCAGGVYIGGDGRLWLWDIFNENHFGISSESVKYRGSDLNAGGGNAYVKPPDQILPFDQGFSIKVNDEVVRPLDKSGFNEIRFQGEYPTAKVTYLGHPLVGVELEAFSPFIPLNVDDSSLPATLMHYRITNKGSEVVKFELAGWLQNPVVAKHGLEGTYTLTNEGSQSSALSMLICRAEESQKGEAKRFDLPVENWEKETYEGWKVEGTAFGAGPLSKKAIPTYQGDVGGKGDRLVNSHASAPGTDVATKDNATGKLTGSEFKIERNFIQFWIGGGNHPGSTCLNLIVDGKVARTATGRDDNKMWSELFAVIDLVGKSAHIEIVDSLAGAWGNIGVGRILQTDAPTADLPFQSLPDYGSMALGVLGNAKVKTDAKGPHTGQVSIRESLKPGESKEITFAVAWHFPNLKLSIPDDTSGRYYAKKFADAAEVLQFVSKNHKRLADETRLWRETWYNSTLPFWFLDRTFANTSTLATTTVHRFGTGRFYAWEGVGCCAGTCCHVWHYAQAMGRLFPELERIERKMVDYGIGFNDKDGEIGNRAEFDRRAAVDGQAGTILRVYREHQMSKDFDFLVSIWSKVKHSIEYLISLDPNVEGILQGAQENTLDAAWYGKISWITSLYLAALRAGEAMALEVGDTSFAKRCRGIFQQGTKNIDRDLFNGEYYIQTRDPAHPKALGTYDCCHIDQVMGQAWAWQVGLGRILDRVHTISALKALYKYNFTPDVGPWRDAHKEGRWYAMPGDGGLIMTTNPKQSKDAFGDPAAWQFGYFNECMSGFEHQVAAHMIAEGMVEEGLTITRAIHDRYRADLRNPWNEIECSDHYARAMASYGSFISICGFEYNGPQKTIGFAPKLTPEDFKSPFTSAEGWGTYSQKRSIDSQKCELHLKYGSLAVQRLAFDVGEQVAKGVGVRLGNKVLDAKMAVTGGRVIVVLASPVVVKKSERLTVWVRFHD